MNIKAIEDGIDIALEKNKGNLVILVMDKTKRLNQYGSKRLLEIVQNNVEFSNSKLECDEFSFNPRMMHILDVSVDEVKKFAKDEFGIDNYPSTLIIKNNEIRDYVPFMVDLLPAK